MITKSERRDINYKISALNRLKKAAHNRYLELDIKVRNLKYLRDNS